MDGWLGILEVLGVLVLIAALALGLLAARQRWLARSGGTFECSLRLSRADPRTGWALGVGRYNEGTLEWFRIFSYSLRPRLAMPRDDVRVVESREPDVVEAVSLGADQRILRVDVQPGGAAAEPRTWELAMSPGSLTGLLSWLEAAPPGRVVH